jgi:aryl-alcohol dehydrogenase-like predicted oxidoreductase
MQQNERSGMRFRKLGSSDILVSELALGTQRWGSTDFNAPDEATCHRMLDMAIASGVNFVDTAEQYPIPDGPGKPEGSTEKIIGSWLAKDPSRRKKLVIASKITGGPNVTPENLVADLEGILKRLGTDYLDVYLLHWPARYTPQANWGQSLEYNRVVGKYAPACTSFEQIAETMGKLMAAGKIRGWGMCNDNTYGLMASIMAAKQLGVPGPCVMQNDYSIINRRIEEQGLSEASAPWNEDIGFLAYNTLAGGVLTGKYLDVPAAVDDTNRMRGLANTIKKRGRMDEEGWGRTLYRYRSGPAMEATKAYAALAKEAGMSLTELALRWCRSRNPVSSVLLGQSNLAQLEEALEIFSAGPTIDFPEDGDIKFYLPEELLWEIDRVHMRNRLPIFSSTRTESEWMGEGEIGETIP